MEHKCSIKNRIIVFLSSSMKGEEHKEKRQAIIAFFDRWPLFNLLSFERGSSPAERRDRIRRDIENSDVIIFVLEGELREGVAFEYQVQKEKENILRFAYLHTGEKTVELEEFIVELENEFTTVDFTTTTDLIDKIEGDLLEDLVLNYKNFSILFNENKRLKERSESLGKAEEEETFIP